MIGQAARGRRDLDDGNAMASTEPNPYAPAPAQPALVDDRRTDPGLLDVPDAPGLVARLGAEALGTFALVLVILGSAMYLQVTQIGTFGVAIAAGIVLAGMIASLGHVSGGHFNPAVSLGAAISGRLGWLDLVFYWVAQVVGAVLAAAILYVTVPNGLAAALLGQGKDEGNLFASISNGWDKNSPLFAQTQSYTSQANLPDITFGLTHALILEAVATAIFVAVTIGVVHRRANAAAGPFAVGFTLAAMILVTGLATGGGLNPARSTASAVFAGGDSLHQLWLFWLAPLVGAAVAGLFAMAFSPVSTTIEQIELGDEDDEDDDEDEDGEDVPVERV